MFSIVILNLNKRKEAIRTYPNKITIKAIFNGVSFSIPVIPLYNEYPAINAIIIKKIDDESTYFKFALKIYLFLSSSILYFSNFSFYIL